MDTSPPSCSAARVQSDCTAVCTESSWSMSLVVSDNGRSGLAALQILNGDGFLSVFHSLPPTEDSLEEVQLGLEQQPKHKNKTSRDHHQHHQHHYRARLETGDPPLNVSEWALSSTQPLWVTYTSSCCSAQAEVLVWDKAGNMKRCHLTSVRPRQQKDRGTEMSRTGQIKLTDSFLLLVLLWSALLQFYLQ